jgi:hypothetical protein
MDAVSQRRAPQRGARAGREGARSYSSGNETEHESDNGTGNDTDTQEVIDMIEATSNTPGISRAAAAAAAATAATTASRTTSTGAAFSTLATAARGTVFGPDGKRASARGAMPTDRLRYDVAGGGSAAEMALTAGRQRKQLVEDGEEDSKDYYFHDDNPAATSTTPATRPKAKEDKTPPVPRTAADQNTDLAAARAVVYAPNYYFPWEDNDMDMQESLDTRVAAAVTNPKLMSAARWQLLVCAQAICNGHINRKTEIETLAQLIQTKVNYVIAQRVEVPSHRIEYRDPRDGNCSIFDNVAFSAMSLMSFASMTPLQLIFYLDEQNIALQWIPWDAELENGTAIIRRNFSGYNKEAWLCTIIATHARLHAIYAKGLCPMTAYIINEAYRSTDAIHPLDACVLLNTVDQTPTLYPHLRRT